MTNLPMFALLAVAMAGAAQSQMQISYKKLSGEPAEFNQHRIVPDNAGVSTTHTELKVQMDTTKATEAGEVHWSHDLVIDSTNGFTFSLFTQLQTTVTLFDPSGARVDLEIAESNSTVPLADSGVDGHGREWDFDRPMPAGHYKLQITASHTHILDVRARRQNAVPLTFDGLILLWSDDPEISLLTHPLTMTTMVDETMGLVARLYDATKYPFEEYLRTGTKPPALFFSSDYNLTAWMVVTSPSGQVFEVPMVDTGRDGDAVAGDGDFTGAFVPKEHERYEIQVNVNGTSSNGTDFTRSEEHEAQVDAKTFDVASAMVGIVDNSTDRLTIVLLVKNVDTEQALDLVLKPYIEVWGKDASGAEVPVAYAQNLAKLEKFFTLSFLTLEMDLKWFARAKVVGPELMARNVYIQNAQDQVVLVAANGEVPIHVLNDLRDAASPDHAYTASHSRGSRQFEVAVARVASNYHGEITEAMRVGLRPPRMHNTSTPRVNGKVVLVHGFCANRNPFEVQASDWSDAVFYSAVREGDPISQNTNEFALDVLKFTAKENLGSFSMVGQSQGGLVVLHLLNYYWTGMDDITEGRRIQSVASPYLGNSAAAGLGMLSQLLYPQCIPPIELSREGATSWMAGISQYYIDQTNIYRTIYAKSGWFGGGWCDRVVNTMLAKPNDGAVELIYSAPPTGGNVTDPKTGYCHKEDMKWPPSFWDSARNHEMNAMAGRR